MKRIGAIACLTALMVMFTTIFCFGASNLTVTTYPEDGQKNTTKENMVVKLYFSNPVGNKASKEANAKTFSITDEDGKKLPTVIKYNPDDNTQAMVLVDTTSKDYTSTLIKDDSTYTMTLSGDFVDNEGNVLGEDLKVSFTTMNQSRSTQIYMVMMVIMFAGMFIFSSRSAKKQMEKENADKDKEAPFNPYKEAKRTGKSVEEVMAIHEKEEAKKAAKRAKKLAQMEEEEEEEEKETYRVKAPRKMNDLEKSKAIRVSIHGEEKAEPKKANSSQKKK